MIMISWKRTWKVILLLKSLIEHSKNLGTISPSLSGFLLVFDSIFSEVENFAAVMFDERTRSMMWSCGCGCK